MTKITTQRTETDWLGVGKEETLNGYIQNNVFIAANEDIYLIMRFIYYLFTNTHDRE